MSQDKLQQQKQQQQKQRSSCQIYLRLSSCQKFSVNVFGIVNNFVVVPQLTRPSPIHIPAHGNAHSRRPPSFSADAIALAFVEFCVRRIYQIVCFVWRVLLLTNFLLCPLHRLSSRSLVSFSKCIFQFLFIGFLCRAHNATPTSQPVARVRVCVCVGVGVHQYLTCCIA